ncbi:MAG: hypothetical protein OXJ52_06130 [Oligoflexia bacterium]|nr:hypothetical protein [Oligoflexia bacterium]
MTALEKRIEDKVLEIPAPRPRPRPRFHEDKLSRGQACARTSCAGMTVRLENLNRISV